jgi:hypothetical protein
MTEPAARIAVLVPCYNEEAAIGAVVRDFRAALPTAEIYVYDNASRDQTSQHARDAGAIVRHETRRGKGNVVRRMFADVEADIYVLVDGDDTYDAAAAADMVQMLIADNLDMVTGTREPDSGDAYRPGHQFGNTVLTGAVRRIFGTRIRDMLSGYRVFSRRFVKSFPALAAGFETETEFTVHALELQMPVGDLQIRYGSRPAGSESKLNTIRDGIRISRTILMLVKDERPLQFFSTIAGLLFVCAMALGVPVVSEFVHTGLVPRFPTAILSASLALLSFLTLASGMILDTVSHGRRELKRLFYLSLPSPITLLNERQYQMGSLIAGTPAEPQRSRAA